MPIFEFQYFDNKNFDKNSFEFYYLFYGENLESLMDLKDSLLNHEQVEHLARNKKFSYLLQACFELASC